MPHMPHMAMIVRLFVERETMVLLTILGIVLACSLHPLIGRPRQGKKYVVR